MTSEQTPPLESTALLARARAGDAKAFCLLLEPLEKRLLQQAAALGHDRATAEDLTAETLFEAWKSLARYDESCRLTTWLYGILLHRHHKALRRARRRPIPLAWLPPLLADDCLRVQDNLPSNNPSPADTLLAQEHRMELRRAIDCLSRKHREVVLLRFFEEASLADMARVLGCSLGTVKSRLHHALQKLRRMPLNLSDPTGDT